MVGEERLDANLHLGGGMFFGKYLSPPLQCTLVGVRQATLE